MSNEIIKVLDALAEKFGIAVDWTAANVIPYLQRLYGKYVNYEIATSIVWIICGVLILLSCIGIWKFLKYACKQAKANYDWEVGAALAGIIFAVFIIVGVLIIATQSFDIVTCYTFPEKVILEEMKDIYESMK